MDMPTNIMHSDAYIAYVKSEIAKLPAPTVELQVIQGTDLRDGGFGGLWRCASAMCMLYMECGGTERHLTRTAPCAVFTFTAWGKRRSTCRLWRS